MSRAKLPKNFQTGYSLVSPADQPSINNQLLNNLSEDLSLPDDEINVDHCDRSRSNKSSRGKGKRGAEDDLQSESTWLQNILKSEDRYLPPSAKTVALKAKILNWMNEGPTDKIISEHF